MGLLLCCCLYRRLGQALGQEPAGGPGPWGAIGCTGGPGPVSPGVGLGERKAKDGNEARKAATSQGLSVKGPLGHWDK